jgi:predicted phage terminase large subunit-like protein
MNEGFRSRAERELAQIRRDTASRSIEVFAKLYLGAHVTLPPSPMHKELFQLLEQAVSERNARIAVAAPRGHAKSTVVSLAFVLWCVCYRLEPFIVLISNTEDQAVDLLATVKHELETNALLIQDFPVVGEPPNSKPAPKRWRKGEIITRNGVKIRALGAGQKIRGRKHQQHRPTLIILDDVENEEEVQSAEQREKKTEWFHKAVMKSGTVEKTNVVVVGTLLHYDSLLSSLLGESCGSQIIPGWIFRKYQAVLAWAEREDLWQVWEAIYCQREEYEGASGPDAASAYLEAHREAMLLGTSVLWPELESYDQLMGLRLREGRASFDSEKQNEPIDPSTCFFNPAEMQFWDDQYSSVDELLADLGSNGHIYGACDPSLGLRGKSRDDTAIVTLFKHDSTGNLYVLDADIQKSKPLQTIQRILEYHRIRKFARFGIEANQFQEFLASEVKRLGGEAGVRLRVKEIKQTTDKLGRIQSLEPLFTTGKLRLSRRHRVLLDQLRQFPKAAHDDGPDALEMAVSVSRRSPPRIVFLDGGLGGPRNPGPWRRLI